MKGRFVPIFLISLSVCTLFTISAASDPLYYRNFIKNAVARRATCNDGTPPAYFVRLNDASTEWLIYLQGGGGCYDRGSCEERAQASPGIMTSKGLPAAISGPGILSADCSENPALCSANAVYIHYCSSDWWAGNHSAEESGTPFAFSGRAIVPAVVEDLLNSAVNRTVSASCLRAQRVVLAGSSAGGVGVFQHADSLAALLRYVLPIGASLSFGAVPDCGWFMAGRGFAPYDCKTNELCNVETRFRIGSRMWGLMPQSSCASAKGPDSSWQCLVGNEVYPFISVPVFPFLFLTDLWQAAQDGIATNHALSPNETAWEKFREGENRRYLSEDRISTVYAVSCLHHMMLINDYFTGVKVNGVTPALAIAEWMDSGMTAKIQLVDDCDDVNCNPTCPSSTDFLRV